MSSPHLVISSNMARRLVRHLRRRGADADALLTRSGVAPDLAESVAAVLPARAVLELWAAAADALDDPALGLSVAREATLSEYSGGYVLANHARLVDGLADACRSASTLMSPIRLKLRPHGELLRLALTTDRSVPGWDLYAQDALAAVVRHASLLTGAPVIPAGVSLKQAAPRDPEPFRQAFGVVPRFRADLDAIDFHPADLDRTVPGADPELLAYLHAATEAQVARLHAAQGQDRPLARLQGVTVDLARGEVLREDERIQLTSKEKQLLAYFLDHPNEIVDQSDLEQAVWGIGRHVVSHAPAVAIRRLRKKIEPDPSHPRNLVTVYGEGWKLVV